MGVLSPKGPCTQIAYTLALKYSLYRYIGPKVYIIFGYMAPWGSVYPSMHWSVHGSIHLSIGLGRSVQGLGLSV